MKMFSEEKINFKIVKINLKFHLKVNLLFKEETKKSCKNKH